MNQQRKQRIEQQALKKAEQIRFKEQLQQKAAQQALLK